MATARTLIFTCANPAYEDFAPLYAASALLHTTSALVEIGVQDTEAFLGKHAAAWQRVMDRFPKRTLLRNVKFPRGILPNTVRFVTTPLSKAQYVYIGDIDILILEKGFPNIHINYMRRNGVPYSNSVRPETDRMSGLHFAEYAAFYPLPDTRSIDLSMNDERVLHAICRLKGFAIRDNAPWFRPVHGIHMSPNRMPNSSDRGGRKIPGWGWKQYRGQYKALASDPFVTELRQHLSHRLCGYLSALDELCATP
jgi:hypothetical protein